MPCLTLRQACHHFDGERVATVAVAVATTPGNRGDWKVSAGERSDAQIRDKSVGSSSHSRDPLDPAPARKKARRMNFEKCIYMSQAE